MKRAVVPVVFLGFALALASCGGSAANDSASASGKSGAAAGASAGSAVATVSPYDSGPRAGESTVDKAKAEHGETLFKDKGCSACHAIGKRLTGPDLAGVTMRRTAEWMEHQILQPEVMVKQDPISHGLFAQYALQMPNQGLTPDEARAVIEYFKHEDHEAGRTSPESH